jgi:(S)-sulfolactate dehydrogenase
MADIVITEFMDDAAVDTLRVDFDVLYDPGLADRQNDIPALLGDARALIVRNRTKVTGDLLDAGPKLVCVGRLGVGLDNIDQPACAERDVEVYPAFGANNLSVAEYVITTAAMLLRNAYARKHEMLAGDWPRQAASGREISGKALGLVGYGAIARDTAAIGRAFGMRIIGYDPFLPADHEAWSGAERMELPDLLAEADIISLHVPLTAGTRHMINADALATMKSGAILINAARGGVVDEATLVNALNTGKIAGAALDVFETEPLTAEAAETFRGAPNLILTPHIGGVTEESNTRVSAMIADKVAAHLNR